VEAEPLHSEKKVVYAEVQEDEVSVICSWELLVYSLLIIFVGILIGRITAPSSTSADFVRESDLSPSEDSSVD
jgi:hypothetical protein